MRRVLVRAALLAAGGALVVAGCSGDDEPVATVLVDYEHDEFATQFIRYLPDTVEAHPGDRVSFKQAWTGEPHTVTFGTAVTEVLEITRPLLEEYGDRPESEVPPEVLEEYFAAEMSLPSWYGSEEAEAATEGGEGGEGGEGSDDAPEDEAPSEEPTETVAEADGETGAEGGSAEAPPLPQSLAQPCLIAAGEELPEDTTPPCEERELPPFTGTETYYNSGIIPYEGPSGNTFEFTLADDIEPGEYGFYCAVHGSFQSGVLKVIDEDEPIATPEENAQLLRRQVNELLAPYELTFEQALQGRYTYAGQDFDFNYAGLLPDSTEGDTGIINEFVPRIIDAQVDEPVVWRMFGPHSISFDVPEYFPIVEFGEDGEVRSNEAVYEPAGGAPPLPEEDPGPGPEPEDGEAADGAGGAEGEGEEPGPPPEPEPIVVDGGTWDGSGFYSSGVLWSEAYVEFTLRVSTPGTYRYACLIHPPMVGTLRVTE